MDIVTLQIDVKNFPFPLVVKFLDGRMWELMGNFEYHRNCGDIIKVPVGFKFDFASIPQPFWGWIGSPTGEYGPAALVHDFLCVTKPYKQSKIDYIFYEAMRDLKIVAWKRCLMYSAVRLWHIFQP